MSDLSEEEKKAPPAFSAEGADVAEGDLVNSSGHVQELDRSFGFWSVASVGILADNAWGSGGGSLVVSLYNGGGPGVMYGFIAAVFFYSTIAACLAELASAIPSSANVYHWASVTAGRYGKVVSFYAGWWNCLAWVFGAASSSLFAGQTVIAMYSVFHPDYTPQRWHIFIAFLGTTWMALSLVLFGQRLLPKITTAMGISLMLLFFITTMVCAIMPSQTGAGYASSSFVWGDFQNLTGWGSPGLVFLLGLLNGAYTIGTPDGCCHLCEEIPDPKKNIPLAILAQMTTGSISTFFFYIAILYAVTDLTAVFNTPIVALPLAAMYQQATRSTAGTFGLLLLFYIDTILNLPGGYITAGRMLWTLARDDAVPFSSWIKHVSPRWRNPFNAQLVCGITVTVLGALYVGNATAFTAFVGSFTIFTTFSYMAAILPHILSRRRHVTPGPFWMPPLVAYTLGSIACSYILVFNVIYMFPYVYPVDVATMNYACVMTGGCTILLTFWYLYLWKTGTYEGPKVRLDAHNDVMTGVVGLSAEEEKRRRRVSFVGTQ
ncbi:hypothetical protein LTR35_005942 [Friedmanniomyces endolithicus]|uniref:Uncharacterized protein n=1 Tax=Friedmanniomyces endolithicus TaxID=329885 RepID=A0AAN6JF88_9PEZI|nr:hypothetical protein LTR35_005942 [Friedmanniomyces endolithicus]KAK0300732.1 hypothetical protein LTS00_000990 [Friedmanniomyces endolithicus]KAK0327574.1 hypothetical protein LTR82_001089 [Friedmanniomyces endolithicus]KAK1018062.1 hypothetical protein LTR54_001908 [Friedmanniomyces endolithicus]